MSQARRRLAAGPVGMVATCVAMAASTACSGEGMDEAPPQQGAVVEFQDHFGASGQLTVVRDHAGALGMMLAEPIADAPSDFRSDLIGKSLVELYEALHPGAHAPAKLQQLSKEFLTAQLAKPSPDRAAAERLSDKSLNTFNSTVCRDLPGDNLGWYWKKMDCDYESVPGSTPIALNYYTGDISAGWNETNGSAYHRNNHSTWEPIIPKQTYYWTQWNMDREGAVIEMWPVPLYPYPYQTGHYGVTIHHKTSNLRYP